MKEIQAYRHGEVLIIKEEFKQTYFNKDKNAWDEEVSEHAKKDFENLIVTGERTNILKEA